MAVTAAQRAAARFKIALQTLSRAGGSLSRREVMAAVEQAVEFTEQEKEINPKSGYPRDLSRNRPYG